jgi:hypothetical protein
MEKKNLKLKNNFTQIITQVSKLYKDTLTSENDAYSLGKKEAYEDILNWFINAQNGDIKYVSAGSFYNMLNEKIAKLKTTTGEEDSNNIEIKPKKRNQNNDIDMMVDSSSPISSNYDDSSSICQGPSVFKRKKYI